MIALDTNVLVRLIARDDARQLALAEQLVRGSRLFVPLIALVETAWVLGSSHGFTNRQVAAAFSALAALENVEFEHDQGVAWAMDQHAGGADLADALLLVESRRAEAFATFDRRLANRVGATAPVPVRVLA